MVLETNVMLVFVESVFCGDCQLVLTVVISHWY